MDKDEFFKIQDEECCYNMINYFIEYDWAIQSSISHNTKTEEFEKFKKSEVDEKLKDSNVGNSSKEASIQYNMIKPYE